MVRDTTNLKSQAQTLADAMQQLAIIGGQLHTEDDITFQGTKFVIPQTVPNLKEAINFLAARMADEEEITRYERTFKYRPLDGARATMLAIREAFGFSQGKATYSFFGKNPPRMVDVATGIDTVEQVPWGAMALPGLDDTTLHLASATDVELGTVFRCVVECPKKYRFQIEGLFRLIERNLREQSIYRGQAFDGGFNFLDLSAVDPDNVVYTNDVMVQLEANVWSPIRHADLLAKIGQPGKRSVLLEGPYGTGKTLAASLTARVATDEDWTFIMCRPGRDSLEETLQTARMYQPAVVFFEDLDVVAQSGQGSGGVSHVLDLFDGIQTKGLKMLLVLTTNHVEQIHKGMIRPGRLDAVIHIGEMDQAGVERLTRQIVGSSLAHDINWHEFYGEVRDFVPAFVKEALDRAIRYNIARNDGNLSEVNTADLVGAARGLRPQLELMHGASDENHLPTLDRVFKKMVNEAVTDTPVLDSDEDQRYTLGVKPDAKV